MKPAIARFFAALLVLARQFKISFASGCAWRAVYVYIPWHSRLTNFCCRPHRQVQYKVFHLGVDPTGGEPQTPKLFGSLCGFEFRFTLPHFSWNRYAPVGCGPDRRMTGLYQFSSWFWHRVDGRGYTRCSFREAVLPYLVDDIAHAGGEK